MSKVYTGAAKKKEAKRALEKRPCVALLFMTGCPHCEANQPAWDEFKKTVPSETSVLEIEAEAAPDTVEINGKEESVHGFPTMIYKSKDGKDKIISGEKHSAKEIEDELEIKKKGGSKRGFGRKSTRRALRRRNRKLGYRTLRHDVSFI
jgi:hypothetical protein